MTAPPAETSPEQIRIQRHGQLVLRGLWLGVATLLLLFTLALVAWCRFLLDDTLARLALRTQAHVERLAEARSIYTHFLDTTSGLLKEPSQPAGADSAQRWAGLLNQVPVGGWGAVRIEDSSTPFLLLRSAQAAPISTLQARALARLHLISRISFPGNADGYLVYRSEDGKMAALFAQPSVMRHLMQPPLDAAAALQHLTQAVLSADPAHETQVQHDAISGLAVLRRVTHLTNAQGQPQGMLIGNRLISLMPLQLRETIYDHAVNGNLVLIDPGHHAPALLFDATGDGRNMPSPALLARNGPLYGPPGHAWAGDTLWIGTHAPGSAWQGIAGFAPLPVLQAIALPAAAALALYLLALLLVLLGGRWVARRVLLPDLQAQHAIAAAGRAAQAANAAKSSFLASISHEIRTPLFGMLGTLELLARSPLQASQQAQLAMAQASSTALMHIIDDLLDYSRIEAGAMPLQLAPFKLSSLIDSALDGYQALALQKGLELRRDYASDLPVVLSDATRLRQILANLLANALKFTPAGTVTVAVQATPLSEQQVALQLAVSDTGIGIDAATAARLFQPFQQADANPASRFGGTGLGLSISQRLAHLLGGQVSLQSTPGQGSTFTLALQMPLAQLTPAAISLANTPRRFDAHVLVADDHPVNQQLLVQQLEALGCTAEAVADGQQASLRLQGDHRIDLLMTDFNMPLLDGLALTRQLRAQSIMLPVIGITASLMSGEIEQGRAAGMTLCLAKPLLLETLAQALAQIGLPSHASATAAPTDAPRHDLNALRAQTLRSDLAAVQHALQMHDLAEIQRLAHRIRGAFVQAPEGEDIADACAMLEACANTAREGIELHGAALVDYAALWLEQYAQSAADPNFRF